MDNEPNLIPAAAVKGIAAGLCMMAFFTLLWAGIAFGGLHATGYRYGLLIFPVFSFIFIVNAIRLYNIAKFYPRVTSAEDKAEGRDMGKWFGIVFGAEGLFIFIAVNVVNNIGHPELVIPAIALIVGLHFYPLAKIFKRTIDYYLATWSTTIAVLGIILSLNKTLSQNEASAFVGIGIATATSCYGIYMLISGSRLAKPVIAEKAI